MSIQRTLILGLLFTSMLFSISHVMAEPVRFKPIRAKFIAALGDPEASSGIGAETWGIWHTDPGPRGVWLRMFPMLKASGGYAPTGWKFDKTGWWLDENGLIMEQPSFPLDPGKYLVTGERELITMLTVHEKDAEGKQKWELEQGALKDVTHLPCRSALYTPADGEDSCSPAAAPLPAFKIQPGHPMPEIEGCNKQDYAVLIVIGLPIEEDTEAATN
ncbi:MAG: hypothetical protein ACPGSM_06730 [Thiolinea sp.]